jgi:hypothetical protein
MLVLPLPAQDKKIYLCAAPPAEAPALCEPAVAMLADGGAEVRDMLRARSAGIAPIDL